MAYATPTQVHAQETGRRPFTASTVPSLDDVQDYLDRTAAELDGILRARGYSLPIATTATSALMLLEQGNVLGAAAMLGQGAPSGGPGKRDDATRLWENFKKALANGTVELEAAKDSSRAEIRTNAAPSAMFTSGMRH